MTRPLAVCILCMLIGMAAIAGHDALDSRALRIGFGAVCGMSVAFLSTLLPGGRK